MRHWYSASRLAGIGLLLTAVILMAGCRADWSGVFGFDDNNDNGGGADTTAPIDQTSVAGLAIAASSRNFGDTADSLRQAVDDGPSQRTEAFDFRTDLKADSNGTNTSTDTTSQNDGTLSANDASGTGPDTGNGGLAGNTSADASSDNTDNTGTTRVILFDDPARLTPILQADLRAGLDLPAKMLVYEDGEGAVGLAYNDPDYLRARYNVAAANGALTALGDDLQTLAQDAAGGNGVSRRGAVTGLFAGQGIIGAASTSDFNTTLDRLTNAIDGKADVELAATIDNQALAADANLSLNPNTLLIVRDTSADDDLVEGGRTVAIDLPQKMLVAVNANGQVLVYYNDPTYIARRHGITGRGDALDTIANDLADLAATATGTTNNP